MILYDDGLAHMVTASAGDDRLTICSSGDGGEWYIHIDRQHWPALARALAAHCGGPDDPDVLAMIGKAFTGRKRLYAEIRAFLEQTGIPHRTDAWLS